MAMTDEALRLYRDAEQSVLGALIADAPANAADVFRQVKAEYFITGDYKHIFETCRRMFAHNDQIDHSAQRMRYGVHRTGQAVMRPDDDAQPLQRVHPPAA